MDINKELADYLKSKSGFNRLMELLKKKYICLSKFSGSVILDNLSDIESYDIGNLLGKHIIPHSSLKVSFSMISKKINEGKFSGFDWLEVFKFYFKSDIITNSMKKDIDSIKENEFFNDFYISNSDKKYLSIIMDIILNDKGINKIIKKKYHSNSINLKNELNNILLLLENIPSSFTALAVYSSITGDPHYLDIKSPTSNLFMRILALILGYNYDDISRSDLLAEINVYLDPISNYVITYKLCGNSILDSLSNEVVNLNLLNIESLDIIDTKEKVVFVFENPSILMSLRDLNVPIIITSGIPNVSVYLVIKKLIDRGNKIFYNGDFDPEGLLIASKLKERFPDIDLFCYDEVDYNKCKSNKEISVSRIKKLDGVIFDDLMVIKELLIKNNVSGYQEQNIERIKDFIIDVMKNIINN